MKNVDAHIASKTLVDIQESIGEIEFGFIAQTLLAIIFSRFGGKIKSVNARGHPDILLYYDTKNWKIEVEVIGRGKKEHKIKNDDLNATQPSRQNEVGYLALLDTHSPARWYMINTKELFKEGEKIYKLFELRVNSNKTLSETCTQELYKVILEHKDTITRERYSGLVKILKQKDNDILFE